MENCKRGVRIATLFPFLLGLAAIRPLLAQVTGTVLLNFSSAPPNGSVPVSGLMRDAAGNLYGTTQYGGLTYYQNSDDPQSAISCGVVYKIDTAGKQTVLYRFHGPDGANPAGGVVGDSAGNLYGTTVAGGAGFGVVYKLDSTGQETVLYAFTGAADGAAPEAGVTLDKAGNLYGTTFAGGSGSGVVFKLDPSGTETVLHTFAGDADGAKPFAGVILDPHGNLYGTTTVGGPANYGVVFKVDPVGKETVLHGFSGRADGGYAYAGLAQDLWGNLYGTAAVGGIAGGGVIFELNPAGVETVLYSFALGGDAQGGVIRDSEGNLYGATCGSNFVYELSSTGKFTVLYQFTGTAEGYLPCSSLVRDTAGNLYGTAQTGGPSDDGVVYQVSAAGIETVLHSFPRSTGGYDPRSGVMLGSEGIFYGTAYYGTAVNGGTVFKMNAAGQETVLYAFTKAHDGIYPVGALAQDAAGNIYGTTFMGGTANAGTVYKVDPSGNETVLYNFSGEGDGSSPEGGVILDAQGNLYGTTFRGGNESCGIVFKIDATGAETVLYRFAGGTDGCSPTSGLIFDSAGNLYGTTVTGGTANTGTIFKVDPSGQESVLYAFPEDPHGGGPTYGLAIDSAGNLYGTTPGGGAYGGGQVFELSPAGQLTVLYSFTGQADGKEPQSPVTFDADGNLYGTTSARGGSSDCYRNSSQYGCGTLYRLAPSGQLTVLYTFTGEATGSAPTGALTFDTFGNLYGTTTAGGSGNGGVVYKLTGLAAVR